MGNWGEFETISQEYGRMVYLYLYSLSQNASLSEELTQETLFRAIANRKSFRGDSKLSTWLCGIAKNLYFEWVRKNRKHADLQEDHLPAANDLALRLEDKESARQILAALHTLDEPYKEVFLLHALGDVSLGDVSRLFGKSDSWARVTYYRAKRMILDSLKEEKQ